MHEPELASMRDACVLLDVSIATLERKLRDPGSDFPKPFVIRSKRYFRLADIRAWIAAKAITAAARPFADDRMVGSRPR